MKLFHCIFVITCLLMLIGSSNAWRRRRRAPPPPPPINCQVGPWTNWGACSVPCGSGIQTRVRAITVPPANGGAGCPVTAQSRACNIPPQHCQVSAWSNWGACTASCGAGTQSRSRSVTVPPANCGNACPVLTSSRSCTGTQCPVNCQVSAWTTWSACSVSCGAGTRSHTRSVTVNPQYGGTACPVLTQSENCQVPPINCAVSPWSNWGTCSESCGEGEHSRTRSVTVNPANCGSACPVLQNTRGCSSSLCPIDCQVGSWSNWGGCSASCGSGTYTRTRPITINPVYDGEPCPATTQSDTCNVPQQDCKVSSWSSWGACTASCGCGVQSQTRQITTSTANCGAACPPLQNSKACKGIQCPVDCQVSSWTSWNECSVSCGNGTHSRIRNITTDPIYGGKSCPDTTDYETCEIPKTDCKVSSWTIWGACSASCGPGTQSRSRTVTVSPENCGDACPALTNSKECTGTQCPVDCEVSSWTSWSECSVSCGNGTHSHTRNITIQPVHGGESCPALTENGACQIPQIDCAVSSWSNWGTCSESCGQGEQTRTRKVTVNPANCGSVCPPLQETTECTGTKCPVDCQVGSWTSWAACSVSCGSGTHTHTRPITVNSANGGEICPDTTESETCNMPKQNCQVSSWSSWGDCTASCGGYGTQTRSRTVTVNPENCGSSCPGLTDSKACAGVPC